MDGMLKDKVALITGTAGGIGRKSALLFAREGARLITADVISDGGEETLEMVKKNGGEVIFIKTDISETDQVAALIRKGVDAFSRLDCAFNCAGIDTEAVTTVDCTEEMWEKVVNVNLKGIWLLMKYEIPEMLKQGKGSIVNIASVCSVIGLPNYSAYTATRFGDVGLSKVAAMEYARQGIRVNSVGPGAVNTAIFERMTGGDPKVKEMYAQMHPMGRICEPEEVAEAACWLCSDRSSFTTGHLLMVDGGFTSQ